MRRAVVLLLFVCGVAQANVWKHAIETGKPDAAQDQYDFKMKAADEAALLANTRGASYKTVKEAVRMAAEAYKAASLAKPDEPEPYYRLGLLLYSFYFECSPSLVLLSNQSVLCPAQNAPVDPKLADEIIAAWDKFEARAPLDPRLSVDAFGESEVMIFAIIERYMEVLSCPGWSISIACTSWDVNCCEITPITCCISSLEESSIACFVSLYV